MDAIRVLIADDHAVVRTGLSTLLESVQDFEVVGEADSGEAAVKKTAKLHPDVVIIDIMMPGIGGIEATREIVTRFPGTKVLILTTSTVSADLSQALEAGALGAVTKSSGNKELVKAIKTVAAGKRLVSSEVSTLISNDPPLPDFTERQLEILRLTVKGLPNPDIARLVGVSRNTIKKHLELIYQKLGAFNRAEAIAIALSKQLVKV